MRLEPHLINFFCGLALGEGPKERSKEQPKKQPKAGFRASKRLHLAWTEELGFGSRQWSSSVEPGPIDQDQMS